MPSPSVPLSTLMMRGVPFEWHDGVAIVAQLVDRVRADGALAQHGLIPEPGGIVLEESGVLSITIDPAHSEPAMPGAAHLLQQLLSGKDQPAALRLFLLRAVGEQPPMPLGNLAAELGRWERPNRQAKLATLHRRALEHLGLATAAATPNVAASLTAPVPSAPSRDIPAKTRTKQPAPPRSASLTRREQTVLGAAGVVVIGLAAWIATGQPLPFVASNADARVQPRVETSAPSAGALSEPAPVVEPSVQAGDQPPAADGDNQPVPAATADAAPSATPRPQLPASIDAANSARPAPPQPSVAADRRPPAASARASAGSEVQGRRPAVTAREEQVAAPNETREARRAEVPPAPRRAQQPLVAAGGLPDVGLSLQVDATPSSHEYRSGDPGVIPPVALARLPRTPDPDTPANKLQVLELHLNSDGTVDTARFVDSPPTYRNRWWTSAAKSWRFRPALKDGRPVRFVLRLVIEDPGGA